MNDIFLSKEVYANLSQKQKEEFAAIYNCLYDLQIKNPPLKDVVVQAEAILPELIDFYQQSLTQHRQCLLSSLSKKPLKAIWGYIKLPFIIMRAKWHIFKLQTVHRSAKRMASTNE